MSDFSGDTNGNIGRVPINYVLYRPMYLLQPVWIGSIAF